MNTQHGPYNACAYGYAMSPLDLAVVARDCSQYQALGIRKRKKTYNLIILTHTYACVGLIQFLKDIYGEWLEKGFGLMSDIGIS